MSDLDKSVVEMQDEQERQTIEKILAHIPADAGDCIAFALRSEAPYYFAGMVQVIGGERTLFPEGQAYVNVGMFQDSVIVGDWDDYDAPEFRFFPYQGNRIEFYTFDPQDLPVYIVNLDHSASIEADTHKVKYLVPPGGYVLFGSKESAQHVIDKPIALPIDKHNLRKYRVIGEDEIAYGGLLWPDDGEDEDTGE